MPQHETPRERKARNFAHQAHRGQVRKYTNEPYIVHPAAAVSIVRSVAHTEEMLCAAWLHDVLEDTKTQVSELERLFGLEVARLVTELTDVSTRTDGTRAIRKALDRAHMARASAAAKTIKLADLIDNAQHILHLDPNFARIYLPEKRLLLDEALRAGDPTLWAKADELLTHSLSRL